MIEFGKAYEIATSVERLGGLSRLSLEAGELAEKSATQIDQGSVINRVKDAVVRLGSVSSSGKPGAAAGFMVDDGIVVTNNHVVFEESGNLRRNLMARFSDGSELPARVVARAPAEDLAILMLKNAGNQHPIMHLGSTDSLKQGDPLWSIGHPLSVTNAAFSHGTLDRRYLSPSSGICWLKTDLLMTTGFSGAPMFGSNGDVMAIATGIYQNMGLGVTAEHVNAILRAPSAGIPRSGWLDVATKGVYRDPQATTLSVGCLSIKPVLNT